MDMFRRHKQTVNAAAIPERKPITPVESVLGLKLLHDAQHACLDIVLVHGLTGNRTNTWTDKATGVYWPGQLLKEDLPRSRILTFGYDADIVKFLSSASQNRIGDHARNLINVLAQLRERTDSNNRPIVFVVHSLGGLVVEDALSSASTELHIQQVQRSTKGICFLGTPHCGSDLAKWGGVAGNLTNLIRRTNKDLVRTLQPDSEVLARIQESFYTALHNRRTGGNEISITCFYEEIAVPGVGFIVPKESAKLHGYNCIGIHNVHQDMTKFNSREDPGYKAVMSEIWRWNRDLAALTPAAVQLSPHEQDVRSDQHDTAQQYTFANHHSVSEKQQYPPAQQTSPGAPPPAFHPSLYSQRSQPSPQEQQPQYSQRQQYYDPSGQELYMGQRQLGPSSGIDLYPYNTPPPSHMNMRPQFASAHDIYSYDPRGSPQLATQPDVGQSYDRVLSESQEIQRQKQYEAEYRTRQQAMEDERRARFAQPPQAPQITQGAATFSGTINNTGKGMFGANINAAQGDNSISF